MKFKFVIATQKPEGTRLPLHDFLDSVKHPGIDVKLDIHYSNASGLPEIYNKSIDNSTDFDFIVFVHDDFHLLDPFFFDKVINSKFDVVGVAGGLEYTPPPTWQSRPFLWTSACNGRASGSVWHVLPDSRLFPSCFGPAPSPCVWLDGQCLTMNKRAIDKGLRFSTCFTFDHYDGDFTFTALKLGLKVGVEPIACCHESAGQGVANHIEQYMDSQRFFIARWFPEKNQKNLKHRRSFAAIPSKFSM